MPRYKNLKPSILGLSTKATQFDGAGNPINPATVRTVQPGEVFEATKEEIPEIYFTQRWLEETTDPVTDQGAGEGTNVGPYSDKNPDPVLQQPALNPDGSTADAQGTARTPTGQTAPTVTNTDATARTSTSNTTSNTTTTSGTDQRKR